MIGAHCVPFPQKALELVHEGELPDVVILDVSMPEISGLEFLNTLRVGFGMKVLPAVFLSSRVKPEEIEAGRVLGAVYLTKPFVASALLKAIDQALKSAPHKWFTPPLRPVERDCARFLGSSRLSGFRLIGS